MKVRNKLTGEESHVCNNDSGILMLLKQGFIEVVDATPDPKTRDVVNTGRGIFPAMEPPKPVATEWGVGFTTHKGAHLHAITGRCNGCQRSYVYDGSPERVGAFVHCGKSERVPKHVMIAYAKGYKGNFFSNGGSMSVYVSAARQKNEPNEHPLPSEPIGADSRLTVAEIAALFANYDDEQKQNG